MNAIVPISRTPITIRPAIAGDYAFVDRLADMHSKALRRNVDDANRGGNMVDDPQLV